MLERQSLRFVLNGLVATAVHFLVLTLCLLGFAMPSAGVANTIAAAAGITASFLGNRHFVFRAAERPVLSQFGRFWTLYVVLALLQGAILWAWTDVAGLDYRVGFLIGTGIQTICTYLGGKHWVFLRQN